MHLFPDPICRRSRLQAEKSGESEDGAETGEDGEEGEKGEKEEKQKNGEEKAESPPEEDPKRHGFLILSREESTMVRKATQHPMFNVLCLNKIERNTPIPAYDIFVIFDVAWQEILVQSAKFKYTVFSRL